MPHSAQSSSKPKISVPTAALKQAAKDWLLDCELRQHSPETVKNRRFTLEKFLWFLEHGQKETCGTADIREFLAYLTTAHESETGRWDNGRMRRKIRPESVRSYYTTLKTFFRWLVAEDEIPASPVEAIKAPISRPNQIQPFTPEQAKSLLEMARKTKYPRRDVAILLFMFDSGCRASEVCRITLKDIDMETRRCTVMGKGNKTRTVYFGRRTAKAINALLRGGSRTPEDRLFTGEKGAMTRSGLLQLLDRLGDAAGITDIRCSPHTCRHFFAVNFLKAGGNLFALQQLLGHSDLTMTRRYVALAEADLEAQGQQFSPIDRMLK